MSNRFLNRGATSPTFGESIRQSHPSSSQSHKISVLFLTQKRANSQESQIIERHSQLNNYIDQLDTKIKKIVQNNQAQLLFAYKNHLEFVKEEMKQFKEETMAIMESEASHQERIELLEKKLIVFREQALKLFQKTMKKDKIIENMQFKLEEYESERRLMNETVKSLMKRNKELQVEIKGKEREEKKISQILTNEDYLGKIEVNSFVSLGMSSHKKLMNRTKKMKDRVMTTSVNNSKLLTRANFATYSPSKTQNHGDSENVEPFIDAQGFSLQLRAKLGYVEPKLLENIIHSASQLYESIIDRRYKTIKRMHTRQDDLRRIGSSLQNRSFFTSKSNSKVRKQSQKFSHKSTYQNSSDSQLKDCFRSCVEVVKKQIARRRKITSINFFNDGCPISLQSFKKLDFMKLLQLLFANQRAIQSLYNSLFLTQS